SSPCRVRPPGRPRPPPQPLSCRGSPSAPKRRNPLRRAPWPRGRRLPRLERELPGSQVHREDRGPCRSGLPPFVLAAACRSEGEQERHPPTHRVFHSDIAVVVLLLCPWEPPVVSSQAPLVEPLGRGSGSCVDLAEGAARLRPMETVSVQEGLEPESGGWIVEHDERRSFVLPYLLLSVAFSLFVSLFWLLVLVGIHLGLELARARRLGLGPV